MISTLDSDASARTVAESEIWAHLKWKVFANKFSEALELSVWRRECVAQRNFAAESERLFEQRSCYRPRAFRPAKSSNFDEP